MTFLLDVNVLIALIDPTHSAHNPAHQWFGQVGRESWATCPITEMGVIRIVSHPKYPNSPGTPAVVATIVRQMCGLPNHVFWPEDISMFDSRIDCQRILTTGQITDSYLLGLAVAHGGQLATFDRRLGVTAVQDGAAALYVI